MGRYRPRGSRLPSSKSMTLPVVLSHSPIPHPNAKSRNTRVSHRSRTRCIAVTISAIIPAFKTNRSSSVSVRNTWAKMSSAWGRISQRFGRTPSPPQFQSPVADLPYDEAVGATASMVEQWKMEQPSVPDLEVPCSVVCSLCCADCFCRTISWNQKLSRGTTAALAASQYTRSFVAC
jgi:hypothetical protein